MQAIARPDNTNRYLLFIVASILAHFLLAGMVGMSNHFQWFASAPDPEPQQRETPVLQMVNAQDVLQQQQPPSVDNFVPSNPNAPQEENHSKAESDVSQKAHTRDAPRNQAAEQMDMRGHRGGEYTEVHTKSSRQQEQVDPGSKENRKAEKTEKQQQQDQKPDPTQDPQQQKNDDPPNKSKLKDGTAKQEPKHDPSEQPPQEGAPTGEATEPPKLRTPTAQPAPDPLDRPPTPTTVDPLTPPPPKEYDPSAIPVLPPAPLSYKEQKEREAAMRMSQDMKKHFQPVNPSQAGSPLRQAPSPASQGFQATRDENQGRGTDGEYSPDVTESEIGKYKAKMRRAVGSRWRLAVGNNLSTLSIGSIQIKFYVQANGVLSNLEIVDDSGHSNTAVLRGISRDALLKSMPFEPFSETMKQKLGAGYQEEYTFSIY